MERPDFPPGASVTEASPQGPGSEYADALRDVVEHAARADAPRPPTEPRPPLLTRPPVMVALAVAFLAVVAWDIRAMSLEVPPPDPETEEVVRGLSVLAAGQAVEAYRREHGVLPESLDEVGLSDDALEYVRSGDDFEVRRRDGDAGDRYDSRVGVDELVRGLIPPGAIR